MIRRESPMKLVHVVVALPLIAILAAGLIFAFNLEDPTADQAAQQISCSDLAVPTFANLDQTPIHFDSNQEPSDVNNLGDFTFDIPYDNDAACAFLNPPGDLDCNEEDLPDIVLNGSNISLSCFLKTRR